MITRTTKYTASDGTEHDSPQAAATFDLAQTILQIGGTFTPMHENMAEKLALKPEALRAAVNAYFEDLEAHPDVEDFGCDPAYFDDYYQMDPAILRKMMEDGILAEAHPDVETSRIGDSFTFDVTKMWHCDGNHPFPVCWDPQCWHKTPAKTDNRICATCDGGPGNDGPCLCGEERWVEPDPLADHREPPHPSGLVLTDKARNYTGISTGHTVYDWLAQGWTPEQLVEQGMAVRLEDGEIAPGVRGFEVDVPKSSYFAVDHASGNDCAAGAVVYKRQPAPQGDPDDPTTWRADLPVDHPNYCRPFGTRED